MNKIFKKNKKLPFYLKEGEISERGAVIMPAKSKNHQTYFYNLKSCYKPIIIVNGLCKNS
jgi:hypothetical protein